MASRADPEFLAFFKDTILKDVCEPAAKFVNMGEEHQPMLIEYDRMGAKTLGIVVGMDHPLGREAVVQLQRQLAAKPTNYAVVFVSECWTVRMSPDAQRTRDTIRTGEVRHHPDRREAIMIAARHGDQVLMAECIINRPNGKEGPAPGSTLGDPDIMDGATASGRFSAEGSPSKPAKLH